MKKRLKYNLEYDEEERALWERAAKLDDRPLSQWIRNRLTQIAREEIEKAEKKH